jgi:hypothetical protein
MGDQNSSPARLDWQLMKMIDEAVGYLVALFYLVLHLAGSKQRKRQF